MISKDDVGKRMVRGAAVEPSDAEKQAIVDERNIMAAAQPLRIWAERMAASDATMMDRNTEEIINKIGTAGFSPELVARYNAKLALRATQPA